MKCLYLIELKTPFNSFNVPFASGNTLSMGYMEHIPDIFLVFDSVFLSLGLASNLFVCFIMTRRKLVGKNLANFYIFHLSMAEVIYRFTMAVVRIFTSRIDFRLLSHGECKAIQFFPHATCATVFFLLAGIAMDRKNHIVNPLQNLGRTGHRMKRIASIWLFSVAISFPIIFGAHVNPFVMRITRQDNSSKPISITPAFVCAQGARTICLGNRLLFYRKCTRFTVCLTYSHISLTVYIYQ